MVKTLFIAWIAHSRRSQLIAEKFGAKLYLVHALKRYYFLAPLRYILQSLTTAGILLRERPRVVFVQNPPIFAAMVVYLYAVLARAEFIIDAHTTALLASWWQWSLPLHAFLSRRAVATIVTNEHLEALVKSWGATPFIIADIPTTFPQGQPFPLNGKFSLAVINTFAPDEPIAEVLAAAARLPEVQFYITGDPIRARKTFLQDHPANVKFTGFLPDADYLGLLRAVNAIVVLTTRDHTMQRGACEAVSLGKPVITSDWPLLRSYFNKGTIHVDNTSQGICDGIVRMRREQEKMEQEIGLLQRERWLEWEEKQKLLGGMITASLKRAGKQRQGEEHALS